MFRILITAIFCAFLVGVSANTASAQVDGPDEEAKDIVANSFLALFLAQAGDYEMREGSPDPVAWIWSMVNDGGDDEELEDDDPGASGNQFNLQEYGAGLSLGQASRLSNYGYGSKTGYGRPSAPGSRIFMWSNATHVDADDNQRTTTRSGDLTSLRSGIGIRVNRDTSVGAYLVKRDGDARSVADWSTSPLDPGNETATLDSETIGGGIVAAARLAGGFRLSGSVEFESGDHDFTISGFFGSTASFDTDKVTIKAGLDKQYTRGRHWFRPGVAIVHSNLDRESYVDSIGAIIPGSELELGQFIYGVTAGTTIAGDGRSIREIRPFAGINGIWNYENENDFVIPLTGARFQNADSGYAIGGGVRVVFTNGMVLRVTGKHFEYDTELDGWSISGGLGTPLSTLGIGSPASTSLVSLDFTGSRDDMGLKAKLRIPLN